MTSPSQIPGLVDKLISVFDAATTVTVYDGPVITDANKKSYVAVGWNGAMTPTRMSDGSTVDVPDDGTVAGVDQRYLYVGSDAKQETGSITCGAVAWGGGRAFKPVRDAVWDIVSDLEQALRVAFRTDAALQALVINIWLASGSYDQTNDSDGVRARVEFTVNYEAHI